MPIKLKVPEGCGGVGLAGSEYTPDEHGCITIPDGVDYTPLLDHGLTIAPATTPPAAAQGGEKALEDMTKAELLALAEQGNIEAVKGNMNKTEIIAAITAHRAAQGGE